MCSVNCLILSFTEASDFKILFLVKRAQIAEGNGITASSNFYVTLKLQNVKSTTLIAKGPQPQWGQEFLL